MKTTIDKIIEYVNTIKDGQIKSYLASVAWWRLVDVEKNKTKLDKLYYIMLNSTNPFERLLNKDCIKAKKNRIKKIKDEELRNFYRFCFRKQVLSELPDNETL